MRIISWITVTFFLTSCSMLERRANTPPVATNTKSSDFDNGETADSAPVKGAQAPRLKKVGVIIGPGGAKSMAAATVVKELVRARIPIQGVVGLEWGALVAALFAHKGQAHEMEWKLYKLEKQSMPGTGFLSGKLRPEKISTLSRFLSDSFSDAKSAQSAVRFSCPSQTMLSGEWHWTGDDSMAQSVQDCLAYPPLYDVNEGSMAATFAVGGAIEKLKAGGAEVVILINVLNPGPLLDPRQLPDSGVSAILWNEIRRHLRLSAAQLDDWIEVDTSKIGMNEFARRKELFAAGEKAGQLAAKRLSAKYGF